MPIQVPVTQTGLEASIQAAAQRAGRNLKIDLGVSSRSIGALSQPLGKITGQADQFTKSMEAANARVLAFGASVGVLSAVAQGFSQLVAVTIQVEKNMADINSVLQTNSANLNKFKNDIFSVAKETGNSFQTVSDAALELSRQGLKSDEVLRRLKDSMILSRLSGLDAASAVEGLTAAVNSFSKEGVTTSDVLNKISKTAAAFSVSERDLIEGFKRSASVAQQAGVSLDELGGIITAVQQKTARGGAVIGNAFKTIFTRIQRPDSLRALQDIGAEVTNAQGGILPATKLIENLAGKIKGLNDIQVASITEKIGGGFQVGPLIAALDDITGKTSTFKEATEAMATAGSEAYKRNTALNQTLAASINAATVNLQELANTLGEIGVTDSLKNILSFFNSFATNVKDILQGEGLGSDFAKGLVKGISAVLSGPGLLLFGAIIAKLSINFVQFGAAALKTFFNIGSAAKEIGAIQSTIASTLLNNKSIQTQILALEGNRVAQAQFFSTALNTQLATMEKMRTIAASIAPVVYGATTGAGKPRAAGGYMPTVMAEANDISKGVGGARSSDRPVVIPNFAFGGGKTGTMVANTGEHIVPNYNGGSGSAIFNRDMVGRMGLPSGAKKIGAAGGFIPNFVFQQREYDSYVNKFKNSKIEDLEKYASGTSRNRTEEYVKAARDTLNSRSLAQEKSKQLLRYNFKDSPKGVAFGMIVNEPYEGGSKTAYVYRNSRGEVIATPNQSPNSEAAVNVPIYGVNKDRVESQTTSDLISSVTNYLVKKTVGLAKELGQGVIPNPIRESTIASTFNKGSAASAAGSVFESAIGSLLSDDDFKDFQARAAGSLMDFTGSSVKSLKLAPNVFNIPKTESNVGLEAKGSKELFTGAAEKIFKINQGAEAFAYKKNIPQEVAKRAASGYIPNFADPLNEAISREIGAGVNPSQVYIDQNNSLKGPMNPSGLMVANRRDEPSGGWQGINRARKEGANAKTYGAANGFVPNYVNYGPGTVVGSSGTSSGVAAARPMVELANSVEEVTKGNRDMLGTIFAVQAGLSLLGGATSDATSGLGKFANSLSSVASTATSVLFVGQGLKSLAKEGSTASAALGKLGIYGAVAAGAFEAFKQVGSYLDSTNVSITKASGAMDKVAKAAENASINLSKFRPTEVKAIQQQREALISGATTSGITKTQFGRDGTAYEVKAFAAFEGYTDKIKTEFEAVVDTALGAGVSYGKIWNMINENSKTGAKITAEEVEKMAKEIEGLTEVAAKFKPQDLIKKFDLKPEEGLGNRLMNLDSDKIKSFISNKNKNPFAEEFRTFLSDKGIAEGEGQKKALELVQDLLKTSLDTKTEESSKAVEALNIEYNKLLTSLKGQAQYTKIINELENKSLGPNNELLDIANKTLLTDKDRANAIEDSNKKFETQNDLIKNQQTAYEGLGGNLEKTLSSAGLKMEDFDKIFTSISGQTNLFSAALRDAFAANDFAKIEEISKKIGSNLGGVVGQQGSANAAILEYIKNLFTGEQKINDQASLLKIVLGITRQITDADKDRNDNLAKRNELLQNSIQLARQSKDLEIKQFSPDEFAKRKKIAELGQPVLNETSLQAIRREAEQAKLQRELQPIDQSRAVQDIQQKSLRDAIQQATSLATKSADSTEVAGITEEIAKATDLEQLRGKYGKEFNDNLDKIIANRNTEIDQLKEGNALQEQGLSLAEQKLKAIQSGVFGGLESGLAKLREENEMFAFNLGERIPSLFADNMAAAMEAVIVKGEDLGDSLRSAASSFLSEITKANIKNLAGQFTTGAGTLFRAKGGPITGGSGSKDDVPAMLMGGEYVMNKRAVSKYGTGFMEALNNGSISGYAKGGSVIRGRGLGSDVVSNSDSLRQTGEGGFQMPGYYGSGAITGKKDLLSYASQAYTSGAGDIIGGGDNSAYIDLTPESVRLTNFGRKQGPMAAAVKESKQEALGLYFQQLAAEKQAKEEEKAQKKAFKTAIINALITSVASAGIGVAKTGWQEGLAKTGTLTGAVKGVGEKFGNVGSSLGSLFTGDFNKAGEYYSMATTNFASGVPKALMVNGGVSGASGAIGKSISAGARSSAAYQSAGNNIGLPPVDFVDAMGSGSGLSSLAQSEIAQRKTYATILSNRGYSTAAIRNIFQTKTSKQLRDFVYVGNPIMETIDPTKRATGGVIPQTSGIDTVPAMLSGGEFIMNAGATQRIGASNLNAMNSGASTETSSSAINDQLISKLDELIKITKESSKPVTVNVSSQQGQTGGDKQGEENKSEKDQNLSRKIKAAVIAVLQEEKRLGGVLRRS
jgi:TP901 family phage tail tape measure protein